MAIELTEGDHNALDVYLNSVLSEVKEGRLTVVDARLDLAHVIALAAKDNEDVKNYIQEPVMNRYRVA